MTPVEVASAASRAALGSGESLRRTRMGKATPQPKALSHQERKVAACEADPGVP